MNNKIALVSFIAISLVVGGGGWWKLEARNTLIESTLHNDVYGEWVAVGGICNPNIAGIQGIDIFSDHTIREGKRDDIAEIYLVEKAFSSSSECELGPLKFEFEISIMPNEEKYLLGKMNGLSILKSSDTGVMYFKMSRDFKQLYDNYRKNAG